MAAILEAVYNLFHPAWKKHLVYFYFINFVILIYNKDNRSSLNDVFSMLFL